MESLRFYLRVVWRYIRFQGRPIPFSAVVECAESHCCGLIAACYLYGIEETIWDFRGSYNNGLDIPPDAWRARDSLRIGSVVLDQKNQSWTVICAVIDDYRVQMVAVVPESLIRPAM